MQRTSREISFSRRIAAAVATLSLAMPLLVKPPTAAAAQNVAGSPETAATAALPADDWDAAPEQTSEATAAPEVTSESATVERASRVATAGATASDPNRDDFMSPDAYAALGLELNNPSDFTPDGDPLAGMEPSTVKQLVVNTMNNGGSGEKNYQGHITSFKSPADLTEKSVTLPPAGALAQLGQISFEGKWTIYSGSSGVDTTEQSANTVAVPRGLDSSGKPLTDAIVESVLSYQDKASLLQIRLRLPNGTDGKYIAASLLNVKLGDTNWASWVTSQEHFGLTALATGDFDDDHDYDVAVYIPDTANPRVNVYDITNGKLTQIATIPLTAINDRNDSSQFKFAFYKWYLPVVSLANTSLSGKDDLVIAASLPMKSSDGYSSRNQYSQVGIIGLVGNGSYQVRWHDADPLVDRSTSTPTRMRFISAVDANTAVLTDEKGNATGKAGRELILAGWANTWNDAKKDYVGSLTGNYQVQRIRYDAAKGKYYATAAYPESVIGLANVPGSKSGTPDLGYDLMPPVALTAGRYKATSDFDGVFVGGVVVYPQLTGTSLGKFIYDSAVTLPKGGTNNGTFIAQAASASVASNVRATEQIVILSGSEPVVNGDIMQYDISWMFTDNTGALKHYMTNKDFSGHMNEDGNGTSVSLVLANVSNDTTFYRLKEKVYGWSSPEILAIIEGTPFWEDVPYTASTTGIGETSFAISNSHTSGNEDAWSVGGGYFVEASAMVGAGLFGNHASGGVGVEADFLLSYAGSYLTAHERSYEREFESHQDEDNVVIFAIPTVKYFYDMWVPQTTVTQALLDDHASLSSDPLMCGNQVCQVGSTIAAGWQPCNIAMQFEPTYAMMSVDEYNETAADINSENPTAGIPLVDMDKISPHTNGLPYTYPMTIDEATIAGKGSKKWHEIGDTLRMVPGSNSITYSLEIKDEQELSNGIAVEVGARFGIKAEAEVDAFVHAKVEGGLGSQVEIGYDHNWVSTNAQGVKFTSKSMNLPLPTADGFKFDDYAYAYNLHVWNTNQITNATTTQDISQPYVLGYTVKTLDNVQLTAARSPRALPEDVKVSATSDQNLTISWKNPETGRQADNYDIRYRVTGGDWLGPITVSGKLESYQLDHLSPSTKYEIQFRGYLGTSPTDALALTSLWGADAGGTTLGKGPEITGQPQSVQLTAGALDERESVEFSVTANPSVTQATGLTYQWQYLPVNDTTWAPIEGLPADSATLTIPTDADVAANYLASGTKFRVLVSQITADGFTYLPTTSTDATFSIVELPVPDLRLAITGAGLVGDGEQFYLPANASITLNAGADNLPLQGAVRFAYRTYLDETAGYSELTDIATVLLDGSGIATTNWTPPGKGTYSIIATVAATAEYADAKSAPISLNVDQAAPDEAYWRITYVLNGGSNDVRNRKGYTAHMPAFELYPATKTQYDEFAGWFTDAQLTQPIAVVDPSAQSDLTLYAGWAPKSYQIQYVLNVDADSISQDVVNPNPQVGRYGQSVSLEKPTREGYVFNGWYADAALTSGPITKITKLQLSDVVLYASWSVVEYPIYYQISNGGHNAPANPDIYTIEDSVAFAPATGVLPFDSWYADSRLTQPVAGINRGTSGAQTVFTGWTSKGYDPKLPQVDGVYQISDFGQLKAVARAVLLAPDLYATARYALTKNIDARAEVWDLPIGAYFTVANPNGDDGFVQTAAFNGEFDGQGHAVVLPHFVSEPVLHQSGLFGVLGRQALVKDLIVAGAEFDGGASLAGSIAAVNTGAIVGCTSGIRPTNETYLLENKAHTTDELAGKVSAHLGAGGITAVNVGQILASSNYAEVSANVAGGIAGFNGYDETQYGPATTGSIQGVFSLGRVTGTEAAGGLVGQNFDTSNIANAYASAPVTASSTNNAGELVGQVSGTNNSLGSSLYYSTDWNVPVIGTGTIGNVTARTTAQMQISDFASQLTNDVGTLGGGYKWGWQANINKNYPYLVTAQGESEPEPDLTGKPAPTDTGQPTPSEDTKQPTPTDTGSTGKPTPTGKPTGNPWDDRDHRPNNRPSQSGTHSNQPGTHPNTSSQSGQFGGIPSTHPQTGGLATGGGSRTSYGPSVGGSWPSYSQSSTPEMLLGAAPQQSTGGLITRTGVATPVLGVAVVLATLGGLTLANNRRRMRGA